LVHQGGHVALETWLPAKATKEDHGAQKGATYEEDQRSTEAESRLSA
jgi:hypothetical protein